MCIFMIIIHYYEKCMLKNFTKQIIIITESLEWIFIISIFIIEYKPRSNHIIAISRKCG